MTDWTTRRRTIVGLGGLLVGPGCLRLNADDTGTAGTRGTADGRELSLSNPSDLDEPARVSETFMASVRVHNGDDAERTPRVALVVDGEEVDAKVPAVPPGKFTRVWLEVAFEEPRTTELRFVLSADGEVLDEVVAGDLEVRPVWGVELEWSDTVRPADRHEESSDTRPLAFQCFEMVLHDGDGQPLVGYDVGGATEPTYRAGAFNPETDDESFRWFGRSRTRFEVTAVPRDRAAELSITGKPLPEDLSVTVRVDDVATDTVAIDGGRRVYRLSLEP